MASDAHVATKSRLATAKCARDSPNITGFRASSVAGSLKNLNDSHGLYMTKYYDVVIVGASHAGAHVASTLRERGFSGSIIMIGEEAIPPYDRPSLSKTYMLGTVSIERILLHDANYWTENNIDLALGVAVKSLSPHDSTLTLSDGRAIGFGQCVLATGGTVRTLTCPGANLPGIHTIRSIADVDAIRAALHHEMRIVIIGAGYIGLEAAAVLRDLGHNITVVEAQNRVLARVTGPLLSTFVEQKHRSHGVDFKLGQQVTTVETQMETKHVLLSSGQRIVADMVIVGIGIVPRTQLAETAGLSCEDGIVVDQSFRTSIPTILAIGDCARHPNNYASGLWRLESVQHALGSAEVAADTIMAKSRSYDALPTFWSDQYDMRLQSAGILRGTSDTVIRGQMETGSFSIFYLQGGAVVALDAINSPKDFMGGRALVSGRLHVPHALLTDTSIPMRQITKQVLN